MEENLNINSISKENRYKIELEQTFISSQNSINGSLPAFKTCFFIGHFDASGP